MNTEQALRIVRNAVANPTLPPKPPKGYPHDDDWNNRRVIRKANSISLAFMASSVSSMCYQSTHGWEWGVAVAGIFVAVFTFFLSHMIHEFVQEEAESSEDSKAREYNAYRLSCRMWESEHLIPLKKAASIINGEKRGMDVTVSAKGVVRVRELRQDPSRVLELLS